MAASKGFAVGNTVRFTITVKVDDVLTAPTTVTITVDEPDGTNVDVTDATATTGVYTATFAPDQSGWHRVKFEGAGNSADFVQEREFYVASGGVSA